MDLTNFEEKHAQYGDSHKSDHNLYWNGFEWEPKEYKTWDYSFKRDWVLTAICSGAVVAGIALLHTII